MSHGTMIKLRGLVRPFLIIALIFIFQENFFIVYSSELVKDTVKIGLLVADNRFNAAEYGAEIAINHANKQSTVHFFKLITRKMAGPWGTGSKEAVDLVFKEKVAVIVTSVDGRNDHLAEQVSAKTHIPILSAWSGDPTLSEAFVSWYFSCIPDNSQQASALAEEIYNIRKISTVALIADNSYDSRSATKSILKQTAFTGKPDPEVIYFDQSHPPFSNIVAEIKTRKIACVVILTNWDQAAELAGMIAKIDNHPVIFTSLSIEGEQELSSKSLEIFSGAVMMSPGYLFNKKGQAFTEEFRNKYGYRPGAVAAYAYDGISLVTDALTKAGNNKSGLRDAIMNTAWEGITGNIRFDKSGNRTGKINFMTINGGRPVLLNRLK